jgi:hypothetical protein
MDGQHLGTWQINQKDQDNIEYGNTNVSKWKDMCKSQFKVHVPPTLGALIVIKILIADFAGTFAIVASILD